MEQVQEYECTDEGKEAFKGEPLNILSRKKDRDILTLACVLGGTYKNLLIAPLELFTRAPNNEENGLWQKSSKDLLVLKVEV